MKRRSRVLNFMNAFYFLVDADISPPLITTRAVKTEQKERKLHCCLPAGEFYFFFKVKTSAWAWEISNLFSLGKFQFANILKNVSHLAGIEVAISEISSHITNNSKSANHLDSQEMHLI